MHSTLGPCNADIKAQARNCDFAAGGVSNYINKQTIYLYEIAQTRQAIYRKLLGDTNFVEQRFKAICEKAGIGPQKLDRARRRGKVGNSGNSVHVLRKNIDWLRQVPVKFTFVDLSGPSVTETEAGNVSNISLLGLELRSAQVSKDVNYGLLTMMISVFVSTPTQKEAQARLAIQVFSIDVDPSI